MWQSSPVASGKPSRWRSVYSDSRILVLDEPLAAMGAPHNYAQVLQVCDRVNLLQHGEITCDKASSETSIQELTDLVIAEYRAARPAPQRDDTELMTEPSSALETTRRSWHAVGELVLAGPQHRRSGTIRLRVVPGGFATTREPALSVDTADLVAGAARIGIDGRTCAELAAATGLDVGPPLGLYQDGSPIPEHDVLTVDTAAAAVLADAFDTGDAALRQFAPTEMPVLWPEHFDVAIRVDEVDYGVSLGDSYVDEPYAYIGPWQATMGEFWNAPFGAARTLRELADVDTVVAFFAKGQRLAHG